MDLAKKNWHSSAKIVVGKKSISFGSEQLQVFQSIQNEWDFHKLGVNISEHPK